MAAEGPATPLEPSLLTRWPSRARWPGSLLAAAPFPWPQPSTGGWPTRAWATPSPWRCTAGCGSDRTTAGRCRSWVRGGVEWIEGRPGWRLDQLGCCSAISMCVCHHACRPAVVLGGCPVQATARRACARRRRCLRCRGAGCRPRPTHQAAASSGAASRSHCCSSRLPGSWSCLARPAPLWGCTSRVAARLAVAAAAAGATLAAPAARYGTDWHVCFACPAAASPLHAAQQQLAPAGRATSRRLPCLSTARTRVRQTGGGCSCLCCVVS